MVVVSTGSTFDGGERVASIARTIDRSIRDVNRVGIFRIDSDVAEIPAASPDTGFRVRAGPILASVVGPVKAAFFCIEDEIDAARIGGCHGDPDSAESFRWPGARRGVLSEDRSSGGFV